MKFTILVWGVVIFLWTCIPSDIPKGPLVQKLSTQEQVYSPQVVLHYDHTESDGRVVVLPEGKIVLALVPVGHPAPLSTDTIMICHAHSIHVGAITENGKEVGPLDNIEFKCGNDRYQFVGMDIQDSKGEKGKQSSPIHWWYSND